MADIATVNTNIWSDEWVAELDNSEYRVWSYLLTNSKRSIAGIYPLTIRQIAFDIPFMKRAEIEAAIARFTIEDKIFFDNGWVVMRNHFKNQKLEGEKHWGGVVNRFNAAPEWLRRRMLDPTDFLFVDFDRVSIGHLREASVYSIDSLCIVLDKRKEVKRSETSSSLRSEEVADGSGLKAPAAATDVFGPGQSWRGKKATEMNGDEYMAMMEAEGRL